MEIYIRLPPKVRDKRKGVSLLTIRKKNVNTEQSDTFLHTSSNACVRVDCKISEDELLYNGTVLVLYPDQAYYAHSYFFNSLLAGFECILYLF